jgi:hypothetical protein
VGREAAESLGGQHLKHVLAEDYAADYSSINFVNIIDLWGVRECLAPLLPEMRLPELPGVSNPRIGRELPSLAEARAAGDGAVLLCDFGWTYLFVAARANVVRCSHEALEAAAVALSASFRLKPDSQPEFGRPRARYVRIPIGERVWNMNSQAGYHGRFDTDIWIAESLSGFENQIRSLLDGRTDVLAT